mgnify:CR=1 FL=1
MALKATIFKVTLHIADMDRQYYADHSLTIARHPSETDERMMIRLLAFALNANDDLAFTKGLSTDDEPELWVRTLTNDIDLWIELGLPEEDRLRKACNRSRQVILYTYGGRAVPVWWEKHHSKLARFGNLQVVDLPDEQTAELAKMAQRSMELQINILDGDVTVTEGDAIAVVTPTQKLPAEA